MFSRQYKTKTSETESDFTIVCLTLFFTTYHYWLCVYHRITNDLFSLCNELRWLHSHKQYRQTTPLTTYSSLLWFIIFKAFYGKENTLCPFDLPTKSTIYIHIDVYVTFSHLRSKELIKISHVYLIPRILIPRIQISIYWGTITFRCSMGNLCTSSKHNTLIQL